MDEPRRFLKIASSNPGWNLGSVPSSNPVSDPCSNPGSNPYSKFRYPRIKVLLLLFKYHFKSFSSYNTLIIVLLSSLFTFQVELVLDMEETVPIKFANRAHVKKHVEYPNKDESKVF